MDEGLSNSLTHPRLDGHSALKHYVGIKGVQTQKDRFMLLSSDLFPTHTSVFNDLFLSLHKILKIQDVHK